MRCSKCGGLGLRLKFEVWVPRVGRVHGYLRRVFVCDSCGARFSVRA